MESRQSGRDLFPYAAGKATNIATPAKYHTHGNHLRGSELRKQLALYADVLS